MRVKQKIEPGMRIGSWEILEQSSKKGYVIARCDCGKVFNVSEDGLRYGRSKKCRICTTKKAKIRLNEACARREKVLNPRKEINKDMEVKYTDAIRPNWGWKLKVS